ncbi:Ribose import binding protein RbsB [Baekduia alba]|uniref:sugar ABC transporter substrate-binding protein n=1 Tax=Baekduia alba TaxID=2997333 RepID=UPI00233F89BB|nr:sugar ABC transporter substrate-binding protein [Baekduia alba]WCB94962.1 Ribose import binding protein RbsB [Baekduia alba]
MKVRAGLAAMVACMLVAVGCGSSSDDTSKDGSSGGASSTKKVKVYMLLPSLESDAYVRERKGALTAAQRLPNAEVTVDAGSARGEATNLIAKIESAVTKGYNVIAINPGAVGGQVAPALSQALAQGTKVVSFDQNVPGLDDLTAYVGYDGYKAGLLRGQWLKEAMPAGGKVGLIDCFKENPLTASINKGQRAGIAGSKLQVVSELEAQCDRAKARTATENMLTAHPDMKAILAGTDIAAVAGLPAVKAFGKPLVVVGGDGQDDAVGVITSGGPIKATTLFPFEELGGEAIRTAVEAGSGKAVRKQVLVEPTLITKDNVAEIKAKVAAAAGA